MSSGTNISKSLSVTYFGRATRVLFQGILVATVLGVLQVAASSGPVEPVEKIAARSDWVFRGEVVEMGVSEPKPGNLVSKIVFTNLFAWKGLVSNRFELNLPGGTLGRRRLVLAGAPNFCLNQQWVVFAMKNKSGDAILSHPIQGAMLATGPSGNSLENLLQQIQKAAQ